MKAKPPAKIQKATNPSTRTHWNEMNTDQIMYRVLGKNYSIWSPSRYSDTDPKVVDATKCPVNHFVVHYNPEKPVDAYATRP